MKTIIPLSILFIATVVCSQTFNIKDSNELHLSGRIELVDSPVPRPVFIPPPLVSLDFTNASGTQQSEGTAEVVFILNGVSVTGNEADFGSSYTRDNYIETTEVFTGLHDKTEFTVSFHVFIHDLSTGSGGNRLVSTSDVFPAQGIDLVHKDDGTLVLGLDQWPDNSPVKSAAKLEEGVWHFVCVVKEENSVTFYVVKSGDVFQRDQTIGVTHQISDSGGKLTLGHFPDGYRAQGASRMLRGKLKQFNLWDTALTHEQISFLNDGTLVGGAPFKVTVNIETRIIKTETNFVFYPRLRKDSRIWVLSSSTNLTDWTPEYSGETLGNVVIPKFESTNHTVYLKLD